MNKNAPNNDDPDMSDLSVAGSGTAALAAENENTPLADGSSVPKWNVPGVGSKLFPEIVPTALTDTKPGPWAFMEEEVRSNVNPPTVQKLGNAPEVNDHGCAKVTASPGATNVAKSPSAFCTAGKPTPPVPVQPVTVAAVPAEEVSRATVPVNVMSPVTSAACACWQKSPKLSKTAAMDPQITFRIFIVVIVFMVFIFGKKGPFFS